MVGNDTHRHIHRLRLAILLARKASDSLNGRLEDISIVVRVLTLQRTHEALEAHTRIDYIHRKRLQRTVGLAVVLHKHDVPDLDHLRIILVDQLTARHLGLLLGCTRIQMDLRARTTRTRIAHLPEVVVLVSINNMVGGHMLQPVASGLVVALQVLLG